jgi:hypothetical protein
LAAPAGPLPKKKNREKKINVGLYQSNSIVGERLEFGGGTTWVEQNILTFFLT